jgi:hypothetical protein
VTVTLGKAGRRLLAARHHLTCRLQVRETAGGKTRTVPEPAVSFVSRRS